MQKYINRELSWLAFNHRVLQEAKDPNVPLYEKIKFLAIFSSNLDEFFRVRVASLRSLISEKNENDGTKFNPKKLVDQIQKTVNKHQEEFGKIYKEIIIPELNIHDIEIVQPESLNDEQQSFVREYFEDEILHHIQPILLDKIIKPFLRNQRSYLCVNLVSADSGDNKFALVEIPSNHLPRFIEIPEKDNKFQIIFLDDIIRFNLANLFNQYMINEVKAIKLTRDAELYIDDEFTGNLLKKIRKGIKKRDTGLPSRFLFDATISNEMLEYLKDTLGLKNSDLVPGGRYHNFSDFFTFPNPVGDKLEYTPIKEKLNPDFVKTKNPFNAITANDIFLYYPYNSYQQVIDFFRFVGNDPSVIEIKVTQYRVAKNSKVIQSLINAAQNGKDVTVFVEIKARFDEELNIQWAEEMERNKIKVYYSFPGLKVHAKIALIKRNEKEGIKKYCYLSSGNFNEKTSKIYTDIGLFTSDERITNEVELVFDYLTGKPQNYEFKNLLVAQFNIRDKFYELIDNEIQNAVKGKPARILAKMNSLEDKRIIKKLYEASEAGVKIDLIIRGICCLNPGIEGLSSNIKIRSIIGRYLEHSRFFLFNNNGNELLFASSADWMKRNLSRRIEVGFPILDKKIKSTLIQMLNLQWNDTAKSRIIDSKLSNKYVKSDKFINSQEDVYNLIK